MEKVACWRTKAAISLKHVKIEEKLLWTAYTNSPTLFRTVPYRPPTASRSPRFGVRNPYLKVQSKTVWLHRINSGTSKAADFKFGRYIYMIDLN